MKLNLLACALILGIGQGAWAAGNIDTVRGDASIINRDGQPRAASKGERVIEGETVSTGASGEVILVTDDSGVLAIRPMSRLLIEKYEISGTEKDTVSLNLLRGALRSITGWIGKTAPRNYRVTTATATVGIRGTDHETVVSTDGAEPGTFDRVYSGETSLETGQGSVFLQSGQTGRAGTRDTLPQLLPQAPAALYPARDTDAALEVLKQDVQANQAARLGARQEQNRRSGGTSRQGNPAISAQCTPNSPAQRALDDFLRAYEQGNVSLIQQRLDPALIGYSVLINDILRDANAQKQTQIRVLDRQMQCGPDVSVIDFSWEKRFIDVASFQPQLQRGRASVLISGLGAGQNGQWRISGFTGDNPFRTSATAAGLQVTPMVVSYSGIPGVCTVSGTASLTGNKSVLIGAGPTPTCTPVTGGVCTFSNPAFGSASQTGGPGNGATTCTNTGAGTTISVSGAGAVGFTGTPGGPVVLSGSFPASGAAGGATANTTLTCLANATISPSAPCTGAPTSIPVNFTVTDPARAGQASVPVQVVGANGDRETFQLNATTPGTFSLTSLTVQKGAAPTPGDGRLEFSGPTNFTIAYRSAGGVQVVKSLSIVP
jgi:FecR protein